MTVELSELPNGLRVVTHRMPHLETASLGIWVNTGARAELKNEHGVAHMLEHMAFKGTPSRSAQRIAEEIETAGGGLNAATSFESTDYLARVLKEDVPLALDLLSDILLNPVFAEEELERERDVVMQEIAAAEDTPDGLIFELAQEAAFPGQPLGRTILGSAASVRNMRTGDLRAYRQATYAASCMVLGAAGAVDHEAVAAAAGRLFAGLNPSASRPQEPARYTGGHKAFAKRFEQSHIVIAFEGPCYTDSDFFTAKIYATLLGGGMSSRLFQEVRERRGLCYDIDSFDWSFSDTGLFGVHSATGFKQARELITVVLDELTSLAGQGPAPEEVARAKAQIKAGLLMSLESSEARANQLAREILVFGRTLSTAELVEEIESVTPEKVRSLAERLHRSPVTSASVGPKGLSDIVQELTGKFRPAAPVLH